MIKFINTETNKEIEVSFVHGVTVLMKQGWKLSAEEDWLINYKPDPETGVYPELSEVVKKRIGMVELQDFMEAGGVSYINTPYETLLALSLKKIGPLSIEEKDVNTTVTDKRSTKEVKRGRSNSNK